MNEQRRMTKIALGLVASLLCMFVRPCARKRPNEFDLWCMIVHDV